MWPNPQDSANLVTFTEEILNGKFHFLCSVVYYLGPLSPKKGLKVAKPGTVFQRCSVK